MNSLGFAIPDDPHFVAGGVAAALAAGGWALGWLAGLYAAPPLARSWEAHAGRVPGGVVDRMPALVRYLVAAIAVAILFAAWPWPDIASLVVSVALALAVALLAREAVAAVHLPAWLAALIAIATFVTVLTGVAGGLTPVTTVLDRVGFTAGERRYSLLTVFQIAMAVAALVVVARLVNRVVGHSIRHSKALDATQRLLAQKLAGIAILVAVFFLGIDLVGIDLTALALFSGAFGLAIGFGLQKTIGNLFAGIILLMDRSVKPGDVISVGDSFGSVNKIGVRAVSIITRAGKEHLIPNEKLMTEEVINWSYSSRNVRISIPVGVAYDCDLKLAQSLMAKAARASPRVLDSPVPKVWLRAFGDNAVEHEIRLWIQDPEDGIGSVQSEVLNSLWDLFAEHGVALPFPQRDVRVKEWPPLPKPAE